MTEDETPERKPAETNPWYVLMTVAGEQTKEYLDEDLHNRNRRYWNGWAAPALHAEEKARLVKNCRVTKADVAPLSDEGRAAIEAALAKRVPDAETPDPNNCPDLRGKEFRTMFCAAGYLFPTGADFSRATFSHSTNFMDATFCRDAGFHYATFSGDAHFGRTTFSGSASFGNATFSKLAHFDGAAFNATQACCAYFRSATFSELSIFQHAIFSGYAGFWNATFSGPADFGRATFSRSVNFQGATFSDRTDFLRATFSDYADFESATFSDRTDFDNSRFAARTSFADANFLKEPPTFSGAKLHEGTTWRRVVWPGPPTNPDKATTHREAYERLKLVMDDQKKFADEHFFLRKELECREIEEPGTLKTFASRIFRLLSDYGWSVERPFLALALVWAFGAELIHIFEEYEYMADPTVDRLGFGQAMALSFSNLFAFLGLGWHIMRDELGSLTAVSEIVAGLQMFAGPILLFLLALGLRNRFRIK